MDAPAAGFMAHHRGGFAPLGGRGCEGGWVLRESAVPVGPAKRPELGSLSCYLWERRGDERRGEERLYCRAGTTASQSRTFLDLRTDEGSLLQCSFSSSEALWEPAPTSMEVQTPRPCLKPQHGSTQAVWILSVMVHSGLFCLLRSSDMFRLPLFGLSETSS